MKKLIILTLIAILTIHIASALTVESVSSSPSEIQPGETAILEIRLENNLQKDVENIELELDFISDELPFAPYLESSEISIDEIREDRSELVSFEIIALSNAKSLNGVSLSGVFIFLRTITPSFIFSLNSLILEGSSSI